MPHRFVGHERGGHGEIQAADLVSHGNSQTLFFVFLSQRLGQALRFAAEDQHVIRLIAGIGKVPPGGFGEEPERPPRQPCDQLKPIVHDLPFEMFPIIQPGTADVLVVYQESQRADHP